jgi:phosphate:Na+ symporter
MGTESAMALVGGLGMFLLGIHHLTEGMKSLAGDALRRAMQKLVSGKFSALLSGAIFTAIVQSSSAALITVIGFVSAGLVTHTQAIAVVLGANLGTTATSWLVAFFGLKIQISIAALPMLGLGGFLWLLGKGRFRATGAVLAGFGLVFTGIEYLQNGMAGIEWNLDGVAGGPGGMWLLAGIGVVMTIIMQSSSAATATTLVALAAGTLNLDQAFAMVVGQNIGTTTTAMLAAIGGGPAVKRTAFAHVFFNLITGVIAMLLLRQLGDAARWVGQHLGGDPVLSLAAFHTLFNLGGILLFYPWLGHFARGIERIIGRHGISSVDRLEKALSKAGGAVAIESGWRALVELSSTALRALGQFSTGNSRALPEFKSDLVKVGDFIHGLRFEGSDPEAMVDRRARLWHALDHLRRLDHDLEEPPAGMDTPDWPQVMAEGRQALAIWLAWAGGKSGQDGEQAVEALEKASHRIKSLRQTRRLELLQNLGSRRVTPAETMTNLDNLRWFDSAFYHAWRLAESLWKAAEKGSAEGLPGPGNRDERDSAPPG